MLPKTGPLETANSTRSSNFQDLPFGAYLDLYIAIRYSHTIFHVDIRKTGNKVNASPGLGRRGKREYILGDPNLTFFSGRLPRYRASVMQNLGLTGIN